MNPNFMETIEIAEVSPDKCGSNDNLNAADHEYDAFLGGDDLEMNPNTYIIGGDEYVFDNVKFAYLQHLYDLEAGKPSTIDPNKILDEMYEQAGDLLTVKSAVRDVICGFECFINGVLLRLERNGSILDIAAVIPPKPDFCHTDHRNIDTTAIRRYLSDFNIVINLQNGQSIHVKFDLPEYKEVAEDTTNIDVSTHPLLSRHTHIYADFKATESQGKKMLNELIYLDSVLHIVIENINKLRETIAQ
ncbi:hypothetical protein F-VV10_0377 [Faustovirus]|nr:hypothetical protein F-VV10_0377 [Faustovirus]